MNHKDYNYSVRCHSCHTRFTVQLFDNHAKNLFLVDNKDWYCDKCKQEYSRKMTEKRSRAHQKIGFTPLAGTPKMISWGEKIREELLNKANYLKKSLSFTSDSDKKLSDIAFEVFLSEWQAETEAKWWIEHRKMTVRDISKRIGELVDTLKKNKA
jgi:uncharacterized protein (DUF2461 family)